MNTFHQDVYAMERTWEPEGPQPWDSFVDRCCKALGVTNDDGDEKVDGYSLGSMHDAFRAGMSVADYAAGKRVHLGWKA
jgi:hypothetical protein